MGFMAQPSPAGGPAGGPWAQVEFEQLLREMAETARQAEGLRRAARVHRGCTAGHRRLRGHRRHVMSNQLLGVGY